MNTSKINEQRLLQEAEAFKQHKQHENNWFRLRLIMGYSSIILLSIVMAISSHILLNHESFPNLVITSAGAALFVDVLGLLIAIWRIVFNADFKSRLSPVTIGNQSRPFVIHSAMYGKGENIIDVLKLLEQSVYPKYLEVEVANETFGCDPIKATTKELNIVYSYAGETKTRIVAEGQKLTLP